MKTRLAIIERYYDVLIGYINTVSGLGKGKEHDSRAGLKRVNKVHRRCEELRKRLAGV